MIRYSRARSRRAVSSVPRTVLFADQGVGAESHQGLRLLAISVTPRAVAGAHARPRWAVQKVQKPRCSSVMYFTSSAKSLFLMERMGTCLAITRTPRPF